MSAGESTKENAEAWTVEADGDFSVLLYQGKEQSRTKSSGAVVAANCDMARVFNLNQTVPKKPKALCAADVKDPAKFIEQRSNHSPELPLPAANFTEKDFPELVRYLVSLFDDSSIGSVKKPAFFDEIEPELGELTRSGLDFLMWLACIDEAARDEVQQWLTDLESPRDLEPLEAIPAHFCDFIHAQGLENFAIDKTYLPIANLVIRTTRKTPPLSKTNTMPAKSKTAAKAAPKALTPQPIESLMPQAEPVPAIELDRYPSNRIIAPAEIAKMEASIREVGVIQPVTARQIDTPDGKRLQLVIGETRWRGCLAIDPEYLVPVFIRELSDKDAAKIHAVENFQRKDLDEIEEACAIQHLKDTGWNLDEIMEFLGRGKDYIYQRLTLLKLGEDAQQALRDGNISLKTAELLVSVPEESRPAALEAIVSPVHSANALPQRQAMDLIERDFIQPAKKAEEWKKRKSVILENHPGAKWKDYEEARALNKNGHYVNTERRPGFQELCDAARQGELLVPTWGELAAKHGAELLICCDYEDEAGTVVLREPLIEAEKLAWDENPGLCIFVHEAAIHQMREESERKKIEEEAFAKELVAEEKRFAQLVLSPDGLTKTATKKLVEMCFMDCYEESFFYKSLSQVFDIESDDEEKERELTDAAILKFLRSKNFQPLEAFARLQLAVMLYEDCNVGRFIFETGAGKKEDFPALHKQYLERKAAAEKRKVQEAEAAAAREEVA
jgi:ParB/RepB/Spo0J family partition protein